MVRSGQRRRARALCKYGNPNVLTIDIGCRSWRRRPVHTTLVEIEVQRNSGQVTAFNGPVEMVAQCEYVPASQVKSLTTLTAQQIACVYLAGAVVLRELDDEQLTQIASRRWLNGFVAESEPPLTAAVNGLENSIATLTVRDDARLELR